MSEILIVDDSYTVRMDLSDALTAAGFVARGVATIEEGRAMLDGYPIALAILDVRLPDGDGTDFAREIRANPSFQKLPILILSSEAEVGDRIRGLQVGANDYVGKPYDTEFVIARVRQLVTPTRETNRLVLVIDDSQTFREGLAFGLGQAAYEVITAASGSEGIRTAAARQPGAIIVDGIMPDMAGDAVIRRIRLDPSLRSIPCLLLTGSDDAMGEISALDAGADAFARKSGDLDVIIARFSAMLRSAGTSESTTVGPKRVLVVDDSPTYLNAIASDLLEDGYDVAQATSGEAAIELLAVQPVDCVLLDLEMPGMSGIEACRLIKDALRDTPVVLLSIHDERSIMLEALAVGADDVIVKDAGTEV
ncbi:MAG TPA: response regulator, partial [Kofleriaceae bacterium]